MEQQAKSLQYKHLPWNVLITLLCVSVFTLTEGGCTHSRELTAALKPVEGKKVQKTLAIGPFDTSKLTYEDEQIDKEFGEAIRRSIWDSLNHVNLFEKVILLDTKAVPEEDRSPESESIRLVARDQGADFIVVGEVKEFNAESKGIIFSEYDVNIRLDLELYNVLDGKHIWEKSDDIEAGPGGFSDILSVVVKSGTVGLVAPFVAYVQKECQNFDPDCIPDTFGDMERARIDAELKPPAVSIPPKPNAFALVIGIEKYQKFPRVDYAIRDSEMIQQYLHQSMGYPKKNIVLLQNDEASRGQMGARIEKWLPSRVKNQPDAEIFVYYGGHGTYDVKTSMAYLVPYDGDLSFLEETAYPLTRLYKQLEGLPAKQVTVVVDSCFSGGGRSVIPAGAKQGALGALPSPTSPKVTVFAASAAKEFSSVYKEKQHGLFTYYWLKGWQGKADLNSDGVVTYKEQYAYVRDRVETQARDWNRDQTPQLILTNAGEEQMDKPLLDLNSIIDTP
jgi:Caspase domain